MVDLLPQSRPVNGLIVVIEGLAVWVVAIFLSSFQATGWLIWPGADMYTTSVGTMRAWLISASVTPFELIGYFGLLIAVGGPTWFWVVAPVIEHVKQWRSTDKRSERSSRFGEEDSTWEDNWISATEIADDSGSSSSTGETVWAAINFDSPRTDPESIQTALAKGDFLRGSDSNDNERNARDSPGQG